MSVASPSWAIRVRNRALRRLLGLPPAWLRRLAGEEIVIEGRRLDPQIQALLTIKRLARIQDSDDVAIARRALDENMDGVAPLSPFPMRQLRDLHIKLDAVSLPARLYVPTRASSTPPLLVYFHGGGFVVGSLRSHDAAVRELAHHAATAILAVEYRLAPEHKAPTAADDAYRAYTWARANADALGVDAERVGVGGDSAGGNIAALLSHRCRDRGERVPEVQVLIYPATDLTNSSASHGTFGRGFLLEGETIEWYLGHYLVDDEQRVSPEVSPLFAARFDDLPPTILVTAGFDPLRDEGAAYADKLREAGVLVTYRCEPGLVHGFFNMSGVVDAALAANRAIAADLRTALSRIQR
jgi:acetyl esterase/lipase